ncbi:hypothetical protein, partial [Acidithiobacillus sp.]
MRHDFLLYSASNSEKRLCMVQLWTYPIWFQVALLAEANGVVYPTQGKEGQVLVVVAGVFSVQAVGP